MSKFQRAVFGILLSAASTSGLGQTAVPNTFAPGTPAKAD
jgi:hypothetical protein